MKKENAATPKLGQRGLSQKPSGPRIGTLDIETSPIVAHVWSLWKVNIGLNQIIKEWSVLSYCYKDLGKAKVIYDDTSKEEDPRDDRRLMQGLHDLLSTVDIIIAQNGNVGRRSRCDGEHSVVSRHRRIVDGRDMNRRSRDVGGRRERRVAHADGDIAIDSARRFGGVAEGDRLHRRLVCSRRGGTGEGDGDLPTTVRQRVG